MKTIKTWLTTITVLLCSLTANAYDFVADGIYYNITSSTDLTVEVTYERKGITVISGYRGAVTIPPTVSYDGNIYSVTTIGNSAFYDSDLTSIAIPESVTSIGPSAFGGCGSLTTITIPESVMSIGYSAFSGCGSLTSITIPKSVTSIESSTFSNCSSLTSATIPESVTSIGERAFSGCSSLTAITIPSSVTSIGKGAFSGCSSLTAITIPEGVTSIGWFAFEDCTSLTSTTIPESVTSIGEYAFRNCTGELIVNCNIPYNAFSDTRFTKVTLGTRITSISNGAFSGSNIKIAFWKGVVIPNNFSSVKALINYTANSDYASIAGLKVYPMLGSMFEVDGVTYVPTSISDRTCDVVDYDCNRTEESVEIGATVSYRNVAFTVNEINDYTFYGHKYIKEISLTNQGGIGAHVLENCTELTSVNLGEGVTSIGESAFYGCNKLNSFELPASVSLIGNSMLADCNALTTIGVSKENTMYDSRNNCNAIIETETNKLVAACNQTRIPESVTAIGDYAFSGCKDIETINIHESILSVGNYAFAGCTSLAGVYIEDRSEPLVLGSNGSKALFSDCPLEKVYIGGKMSYNMSSYYGYSPFSSNTSLHTVTISNKEDKIYDYEFYNCSGLKDITIGDGVATIGDYAFSGCASLENLSFGSSMISIGANAFGGCGSLAKIESSAVTPPACDTGALDDLDKWNCVLYMPVGYMAAYQEADQWKEFLFMEDIIPIKMYTLTYMVDGIVYHTEQLAHNQVIMLPNDPTKEGYSFVEWIGLPTTMPISDVIVNASFTINEYTLTYTVDGEEYKTETLAYGTELTALVAPTKEGYTFSGWSELPETMPAKDITITGSFNVNHYMLTYIIDGVIYQSEPVAYGTAITMLEAPAKSGYSFDGWDTVLSVMPAEDVTINGSYTRLPIENFIILDSDEGFISEENLQCDMITYTRNFKNTNWQALYVPFEIPYEVIKDDFAVAYINDVHQFDDDDDGTIDRTRVEAIKVTDGVLKANYPYMIRAKVAGEKSITVTDATLYATEENSIDCSSVFDTYTFTGTYSKIPAAELPKEEGYYALSGGSWKQFSSGATSSLGAFRIYMKIDSRDANAAIAGRAIEMRVIGDDEEETTGMEYIESTVNGQQSTFIYDLQGRRVEHPVKGLYIVNGEKVWIK